MGGYADRNGDATGTLDELEIGALSLQCGVREIAFVTADVIGVDAGLVSEVARATGLPEDDMLICASHTHSGPLGVINRLHPAGPVCLQPEMRERLVETMARTIQTARAHLEPVRVEQSDATVDNAWSNRNYPNAAADLRVRSLQVRRLDGSLQCLLILIPCHPTVLGAWNTGVSADLHGGVRRAVRARMDGQNRTASVLTATGAAGDISTRFARRESSAAEVDRLGNHVADRVIDSLKNSTSVSAGIRMARSSVALPMRSHDIEAAQGELKAARQALAQARNDSASDAILRQAHTRVQGAEILCAMGELQSIAIVLRAWRLGADFALMSVPGELFSSLGRQFEAGAPLATTWVIGYANGYAGYFPDLGAFNNRTYEALASPYDPSIGPVLLDHAARLASEIARHTDTEFG